jgi:hypothetical protein
MVLYLENRYLKAWRQERRAIDRFEPNLQFPVFFCTKTSLVPNVSPGYSFQLAHWLVPFHRHSWTRCPDGRHGCTHQPPSDDLNAAGDGFGHGKGDSLKSSSQNPTAESWADIGLGIVRGVLCKAHWPLKREFGLENRSPGLMPYLDVEQIVPGT